MDVEDNTITDNQGHAEIGRDVGILVEYADGSIRDNTPTNNRTGVVFAPGYNAELRSNTIRNSLENGIELLNTSKATIVENESSNNGGNGIYVASGSTGNTLRDNKTRTNGTPLANTYRSNTCKTSNPSGLCK